MTPAPLTGSPLFVPSPSALPSTPSPTLNLSNTSSSTPTVLDIINKLNSLITSRTASLTAKNAAQMELQTTISHLQATERAFVRDFDLLTYGHTLVQELSAKFHQFGKPISKKRKLDLPTEITPVLECLEKKLSELEKEHTKKADLYARLRRELSNGKNELRALNEKMEFLVKVQKVMDARTGTKVGEDEVVGEIRAVKEKAEEESEG